MPLHPPPVKICIVGVGAHSEQTYLPILSRMPKYRVESLVDIDIDRCRHLAQRYGVPHYSRSIDEVPSTVEAAVVVVPHYLHPRITCELLSRGLHVLCEKPMATTVAEAEAMVRCAKESVRHLQIGNIFRQYWTSARVKQLLDAKSLGDLVSFHIEVGYVHVWPTISGFFFDRAKSGGGVLIDMGAHVVDLLLWWLQDYPLEVQYRDDSLGGVEAECHLELRFGGSLTGTVRLSRLMTLDNSYTLIGRRGRLSFRPYDSSGVCNAITMDRAGQVTSLRAERPLRYGDYCERQLDSFFHAVRDEAPSTAQAESVIPSIKLIEECYRHARRMTPVNLGRGNLPDEAAASDTGTIDLTRARVFVTGASGFIGGRVAERLYLDFGNRARCLSRSFSKLALLSRLPVDIVIGDLLDQDLLVQAMAGCDVVIHCAYGNTRDEALNNRINIVGTENVVKAAIRSGVKKFVYLSSVEVYGENQPAVVDETTPTKPSRNDYGNSKLEAERLCFRYHQETGLPVVVLRLGAVYGPHSPIWTISVVSRLRNRGFALCDRFNGVCNPVYVDDCVDAIFLASANGQVAGETFLVSGSERFAWNDYFRKYNDMLGLPPLATTSLRWLRVYRLIRQLFDTCINRLSSKRGHDMLFTYGYLRERGRIPNLKAILQQGSLLDSEDIFARPTHYSIEKARTKLGFEPRHDFESGLRLVRQWLDGRAHCP